MWYYASNGQQNGPVTEEALRAMLAQGTVLPSDLVWREGMGQWEPAGIVLGGVGAQPIGYFNPMQQPIPPYAGWWIRFLAVFLDAIIVAIGGAVLGMICGAIVGAIMGASGSSGQNIRLVAGGMGQVIGYVVGWLYEALLLARNGQTIGKMALGIKVVRADGKEKLSFGRATGRHFAKMISAIILLIGYIMAAFTEKKQALHDIMCDTIVVKAS